MLPALPELCSGCDDDVGPPWCCWAWCWLLRWWLLRWWLPRAAEAVGWLVQDRPWLAAEVLCERGCSREPFSTSNSRLSSLPRPPRVIPPSLVIVYTLAGFTATGPCEPLAVSGSSMERLRSAESRRLEGPSDAWAWRVLTWDWDCGLVLGLDWLDWAGLAMDKQRLCGGRLLLCKWLTSGESWPEKVSDSRWSGDKEKGDEAKLTRKHSKWEINHAVCFLYSFHKRTSDKCFLCK